MKICVWQLFSLVFPAGSKPRQFHCQRSEKISLRSWKCHSLLFFVNKLTPPLSYFCTHEMGWRCQDIFDASVTAPLNSLWFHFIPPVSWYFALESLVSTFYVQWSCWLCQSSKTSRASLVVFVKKTLKGKFAGKHVLPHRWHFFNLGDVLTKKPVTTQDDEDCYKSLVSKNTKSSPLLSRDLRPGQSCSRYRVWPNQEPFAFAVLRLNISEAGWQRSENLKWKRPALLLPV